jgi:hypothetical protein
MIPPGPRPGELRLSEKEATMPADLDVLDPAAPVQAHTEGDEEDFDPSEESEPLDDLDDIEDDDNYEDEDEDF